MPSIEVKEKKWYRRLISCFRRQKRKDADDDTGQNLDKSVFVFKDEFELRLHEENLLYRRSGCNDHPVLNIGIGLTSSDLCGIASNYRYYTNFRHPDIDLYIQPGFEQVTEEVYYDEPIIDGLPATLWLECIEPTLDILSSLSILKHRKSNLVMKKPRPTESDSQYSHHGDFEMEVIEMLNRRLSSALNGSLREIQDTDGVDANFSHRHPNRRRHEREERVLLNINQSANHDDDYAAAGQQDSSSSVQQDNLNPDIPAVVHHDDDADDDVAAAQQESDSVQQDNINPEIPAVALHDDADTDDDVAAAGEPESSPSVQQDNLDPDIPAVAHHDGDDVEDDLVLESLDEWELPAKYNPTSNPSATDPGIDGDVQNGTERNTATGDSCSVQNLSSKSRKKSKRKRTSKPHPHLYFWNPDNRQFEKTELRNYPLNTLMLFKCGVKYYFQVDDKQNEKELCNRLTYLSRMDIFTRRLIMSSTEDFFNRTHSHEITSQEMENAQRFLQLKGISPKYGASQLTENTEANNIELPTQNEGFFRRKINNVRRFFSGTR